MSSTATGRRVAAPAASPTAIRLYPSPLTHRLRPHRLTPSTPHRPTRRAEPGRRRDRGCRTWTPPAGCAGWRSCSCTSTTSTRSRSPATRRACRCSRPGRSSTSRCSRSCACRCCSCCRGGWPRRRSAPGCAAAVLAGRSCATCTWSSSGPWSTSSSNGSSPPDRVPWPPHTPSPCPGCCARSCCRRSGRCGSCTCWRSASSCSRRRGDCLPRSCSPRCCWSGGRSNARPATPPGSRAPSSSRPASTSPRACRTSCARGARSWRRSPPRWASGRSTRWRPRRSSTRSTSRHACRWRCSRWPGWPG